MPIYVWTIPLLIVNAFALGLDLLGLPGNWLMVGLTWGVALWQWHRAIFSLPVLIAITVLAAVGEVLELVAGVVLAKKAGGTRRAALGALIGGIAFAIVGTSVIPIIGSMIGGCVGAFLGALVMELTGGRQVDESVRAGVGAGLGQFLGLNLKLLAGLLIWLTVAVSAFWP